MNGDWDRWSRDPYDGPIARMHVQRLGVDVADTVSGIFERSFAGQVRANAKEQGSPRSATSSATAACAGWSGTATSTPLRPVRCAPGNTAAAGMSPLGFLERVVDLLAPSRKHRHRYCGVLAPGAKLRRAVTATAGPAGTSTTSAWRWNGQQLDQALPWLEAQLAAVRAVHPDRELVISEPQ